MPNLRPNDACLLTIIRKRSIIVCADNDYPFHIHAVWSNRNECLVATSIQQMHTSSAQSKDSAVPIIERIDFSELSKERRIQTGEKQRKRFRQQASGGSGDIADCILHCSGCWKIEHNVGTCRAPPKLPVFGLLLKASNWFRKINHIYMKCLVKRWQTWSSPKKWCHIRSFEKKAMAY